MGKVHNIYEIIPKDFPDWAKEAFEKGNFFRVSVQKVESAERFITFKELDDEFIDWNDMGN